MQRWMLHRYTQSLVWRHREFRCNASGHTREAWCEQNGIKIKTFYYWQRQLCREAHDAHMTALHAKPEVAFSEVALPASPKPVSDPAIAFCPDAVIRTRTLTIEVSNHASREVLSLIRSVMKMLRYLSNLRKIYIACGLCSGFFYPHLYE